MKGRGIGGGLELRGRVRGRGLAVGRGELVRGDSSLCRPAAGPKKRENRGEWQMKSDEAVAAGISREGVEGRSAAHAGHWGRWRTIPFSIVVGPYIGIVIRI